jgi:hypothetical protein
MRCAICGIQIDSVDEAVEEGWIPYFYDGETEREVACPACTQVQLQEGTDGEWEVKEEFRGKLKYLRQARRVSCSSERHPLTSLEQWRPF